MEVAHIIEELGLVERKWFPLNYTKQKEDFHYSWPEDVERAWDAHTGGSLGGGLEEFFAYQRHDMGQMPFSPAIFIFFPQDYDMSGHVAQIRKVWENAPIFNYGLYKKKASHPGSSGYFGMGGTFLFSKYILRKLAEESSLFQPIWEDLKDISSDEHGIYLAAAPDSQWLESIRPAEERLWAEFRDARNLDLIGPQMRKPQKVESEILYQANLLIIVKEFQEAERLLEGLLREEWEYWPVWEELIYCLFRKGDPSAAYDVVLRGMKKYPDCLWFDRFGYECCMGMEDWSCAEGHLKRSWGLNPWDPLLMIRYATLAFRLEEYPLAAMLYEGCCEHGTLHVSRLTDYGVALSRIGRLKEALVVFKEIESIGDPDPMFLNNTGMMLASLGHPLEALDYCRRGLEMDPSISPLWDSLGFTHLKLGQYEEAEKAFLKAIELEEQYPDAWRHLLHIYYLTDRHETLKKTRARVGYYLPKEVERFEREKGKELLD